MISASAVTANKRLRRSSSKNCSRWMRLHFCTYGNGGSWPGPEILAINLISENQPFDSIWHEKFRCNRHGQLMADCVMSPTSASENFSSKTPGLAERPLSGNRDDRIGHKG